MVFPQHFAYDAGGFLKTRICPDPHVIHGVEDAAVHGFQTVTHIRQGARNDHTHRVVQICAAHLFIDIHLQDSVCIHTYRKPSNLEIAG